MEGPAHRTRRKKTPAPGETIPLRRSTRKKGGATTREVEEVAENVPVPEPVQDQILVSEAVVVIPFAERMRTEQMLNAGLSPDRSADEVPSAASGSQTPRQGPSRTQGVRRSLVGLGHSMSQKAVRRASRRSLLKKKAKLSNSTCRSSDSEDISMDTEPEDQGEQVDAPQKMAEPPTVTNPEPEIVQIETCVCIPEPEKTKEKETELKDDNLPEEISQSPSSVTQPMADTSDTDDCSGLRGDVRSLWVSVRRKPSGPKHRAVTEISTPINERTPIKKFLARTTPRRRSFIYTMQKNRTLMTPGSLDRKRMKSSSKQSASKTFIKELERQNLNALNTKMQQEYERKMRIEEKRLEKRKEMKRKRDERLKRAVEARVKGEKEKEQEIKKKFEEKMARLEERNDMMQAQRKAEEEAKRKVAAEREEELQLRKDEEEIARLMKVQQAVLRGSRL